MRIIFISIFGAYYNCCLRYASMPLECLPHAFFATHPRTTRMNAIPWSGPLRMYHIHNSKSPLLSKSRHVLIVFMMLPKTTSTVVPIYCCAECTHVSAFIPHLALPNSPPPAAIRSASALHGHFMLQHLLLPPTSSLCAKTIQYCP